MTNRFSVARGNWHRSVFSVAGFRRAGIFNTDLSSANQIVYDGATAGVRSHGRTVTSAVPPPIRRHYRGGARIICRFAQVRTRQSTYTSENDVSTYETNNVVKVRGCEEKRGAR